MHPPSSKTSLCWKNYSIGRLSFNSIAKNRLKSLQNLLTERGVPARLFKLVILYDFTNKTLSKHRSNNIRATNVKELLRILRQHRNCIEVANYTRPEGTPDILRDLLTRKIPVLKVQADLILHRKSKDAQTLDELRQTHPSLHLDAQLLSTVGGDRADLTKLHKRKEPKKNNRPKEEQERARRLQEKKQKVSLSHLRCLRNLFWSEVFFFKLI